MFAKRHLTSQAASERSKEIINSQKANLLVLSGPYANNRVFVDAVKRPRTRVYLSDHDMRISKTCYWL